MKQTIRIATFNILNLQEPEVTFYGRKKYSHSQFDRKKKWVSQMLDNLNADIIGFQEIFSEKALREVVYSNTNYEGAHIAMGSNKEGLPSVALVSRYPIVESRVFQDFPEQLVVDGLTIPFCSFSRPVLQCKVQVNEDHQFIVVVAHLKSKRPMIEDGEDYDDPLTVAKGQARSLLLRASEAAALRTILMEVLQNRAHPVVVMGDLNDTHTSVTTRIISGDPPFRHLPMQKKLKIWDVLLYHAKDIKARISYEDTYYTHIHNGHHEALDHIMVSEELVRENPDHIGRIGDIRVFNDHLIDETMSDDRIDIWKSDHAQVVVSIEMRN
jgi:predicted extracellular nuclease